MTRSEQFKNIPPRKKIVRIETYLSQTLLCSDGAKGLRCKFRFEYHKDSFLFFCLAVFTYHEDPRGKLPKAIWSWAAKVCRNILRFIHFVFLLSLVWCSTLCENDA